MEVEAAKMIGAGLAVIALMGVGVGIGNIFSTLIASIARNPAARSEVFPIGILGFVRFPAGADSSVPAGSTVLTACAVRDRTRGTRQDCPRQDCDDKPPIPYGCCRR